MVSSIRPPRASPATEKAQELNLDSDIIYEFACRRPLPRIDCRKTIKHAILSPRVIVCVNRVLHRTKHWVPLWYAAGLVCGSLVLFVPSVATTPSATRWLAIATFILGLPSHCTAFLALRFDVLKLVIRTFEFWYITLLNAGTMSLLCVTLQDMRALVIGSATLAFQVAFCIDAIFRVPQVAIATTTFGAIANVLFIVASGFQFLPNIHRYELVKLRSREITSDDIITNTLATVALLLTRNAYRKYQSLRPAASVGPLAGLVCYHVLEGLIDEAWHGWRLVVSLVAFLSGAGFCGVYFAHSQRELLLRELGRSFDFLFVATQVFCAHLCVCDLYAWDLRCLNVATTWLWAYWMLTLDAITPVMKRKLGFHKVGAAVVGLILLFVQTMVIVAVLWRERYSTRLQHRIIFSLRIGERTFDASVISVLMGRVFVTWLWTLRIGWRLFDRQEAELLVLQGQLQYEEDAGARKLIMACAAVDPATSITTHAVAPT